MRVGPTSNALVGDRKGEDTWREGRRPHEDGGRDWGAVATRLGVPGAQELQETRRDGLSEPLEGRHLIPLPTP